MIRATSISSAALVFVVAYLKPAILIIAAKLLAMAVLCGALAIVVWLTFIYADVQRGPAGWPSKG